MKLGCNLLLWMEYQAKEALSGELRTHPSLLLTGASGSGKSYALKWLSSNLLEDNVELFFCNFKDSEDFRFLKGYKQYYTFRQCNEGLNLFYECFNQAQESGMEFSGKYHVLIFDEFPAFIQWTTMQDKKLAETYKMMVSELLMLGRSYGFGVWLVMQRPDSAFLANGARDNFQTTISLGNLSKEARSMLYSGLALPDRVYKASEGICWIDGVGLTEIKFPKIRDIQALEAKILNRLPATNGKQTGGAESLSLD